MGAAVQGKDRAQIELPEGTRGLTAFALALGTFMQVLDITIANVSLPTIAGSLGVSPNQGTWIITSFAVSNGISVPLTGWLMRRYGVVRTFVTAWRCSPSPRSCAASPGASSRWWPSACCRGWSRAR